MSSASRHAREWLEVAVLARVWGWVGGALACVAVGIGLAVWLIPGAFFWLLFGG